MMKTCAFLLGVLAFGSVARGQDAEDENIQYEKLKVLEPIIGTWTFTWAGREPTESTYAWSASKKMIVATYRARNAEPGEGPASESGYANNSWAFCVWNDKIEKIGKAERKRTSRYAPHASSDLQSH